MNNAPESIMLTNWNSVVIGAFFMVNDILHRANRKLALRMIPAMILFAAALSIGELKLFGSITLAAALLIDWTVFDRLYFRNGLHALRPQSFYRDSTFWAAVVASNFACAFVDSVLFSFVFDALKPLHPTLFFIGLVLPIIVIAMWSGMSPEAAQGRTTVASISLIFVMLSLSNEPWVDPFAIKITEELCVIFGCNPDKELSYLVDMISTSVFKIVVPFLMYFLSKFIWRAEPHVERVIPRD
jgi:hypothetical protein